MAGIPGRSLGFPGHEVQWSGRGFRASGDSFKNAVRAVDQSVKKRCQLVDRLGKRMFTRAAIMNVNIETPNALRRKMTIELEAAEIKSELDRTYNELRRSVQLRGFRPGHAPRNLLERFFEGVSSHNTIRKLLGKRYGLTL